MRSPCLGGDVPEDRSDVPVAVEQYPEDDESQGEARAPHRRARAERGREREDRARDHQPADQVVQEDRKSTRLNSSHVAISYAVFCLKKKIEGEVHLDGI